MRRTAPGSWGSVLTATLTATPANRGERRRTMRPRTSKPLVGILGDVDGRIVPVAPPPVSNLGSDRELRRQSLTGVRSHSGANVLTAYLTAEQQLYRCRTHFFLLLAILRQPP